MKFSTHSYPRFFKTCLLAAMVLLGGVACERSVDGLEEPGFSENPNVFIDGFSAGLNYAVFDGAVPEAFQVDTEVKYGNTGSSMRFAVPDVNDPRGSYAGGAFFTSSPRDLTGYNALTFWVKANESVVLDVLGFGVDLGSNTYDTSIGGLRVNSNWEKVIIPLPDPAKLNAEQGMFYYSFGPNDGRGYTVHIDQVQYERLGTVAQPRAAILNGEDQTTTTFNGVTTTVGGLVARYNLPNGIDQPVMASPAYFEFNSSNQSVATVDGVGNVTVVGEGEAVITATLSGAEAEGSLTIDSQGEFIQAPIPTEPSSDVISIFSNAYENRPVDFYNGFYAPFQTTTSNDFVVNGDNVLNYENFNFVGIEFNQNVPTIDASAMTELTMDIFVPGSLPNGASLRINLRDFGPDQSFDGGDDSIVSTTLTRFNNPALVSGQWMSVSFDITGLANRNNLGQIVLDTAQPGAPRPSSFYVDNIYLRR